jgi:molybdopterin converting factor small subunit
VRVLAFGRLSGLPLDGLVIPPDIRDVEGLRQLLGQRWPELNEPTVRLVVNQTLVNDNIAISPGDEIAFLPPMSGG